MIVREAKSAMPSIASASMTSNAEIMKIVPRVHFVLETSVVPSKGVSGMTTVDPQSFVNGRTVFVCLDPIAPETMSAPMKSVAIRVCASPFPAMRTATVMVVGPA